MFTKNKLFSIHVNVLEDQLSVNFTFVLLAFFLACVIVGLEVDQAYTAERQRTNLPALNVCKDLSHVNSVTFGCVGCLLTTRSGSL